MRILRIRLANLNSLRGEHTVDFEHGPLARGGLFLIAGPTGAGKSTLLDAITLALYGRAARYAKDPNPVDMMTRLCGECRAEVEFEVSSGRYRAEWQLRRARGKPDGAVQPAKRYVYDASGQPLTQQIREAEVVIEKLVGLDYPRFLRSVLLAQGEFARFLHAAPDERAGLLESLTGTEIYGDLSVLAHEETTRREAALADQEKDLGRVTLLTPEQRAELVRQIEQREQVRSRQRAELEQRNREYAQAGELDRLLQHERGLLAEQAAVEQRAHQAEAELAQLARHRQALPYAEELSRLESAHQHLREEVRGLETARRARDQSRRDWLLALLAVAGLAEALVKKATRTLNDEEKLAQAAETKQQEAADWLKRHDSDRSLSAGLPDLAIRLRALETGRNDLAKGRARAEKLALTARRQAERISAAVTTLEQALGLLRQRESEKTSAAQTLESLLQGETLEAREEEIEILRTQIDALGKLILVADSERKKRQAIEASVSGLAECKLKLEQARGSAAETLAKKEAAQQALALRQDHLQRARVMASLEEHRATLRPGEPCPLCGATEHPFSDPSRSPISDSTLEAEVCHAREMLTAAETVWRTADQSATRLSADQTNRALTLARDEDELNTIRAQAGALAAASGLEAVDLAGLNALKTQRDDRLAAEVRETTRIRAAMQAFAQAERACSQAENESRLAGQGRSAAEGLLAQCEAQIREQTEANTGLDQQLAESEQALAGLLSSYAAPLPEPGRESTVLDQLTNRRNEFQARDESLRQWTASLAKAKHSVERSRQTLNELARRSEPVIAQARLHATEPDLPSPAAQAALAAKWTSLEQAELAVRQQEGGLTAAEAAAAHCQDECARAQEACQRATAALEARLAGSVFASLAALRSARLAPGEAGRLEQLEQQLRRETDSLQGRLTEARTGIGQFREAKVAEGELVQQLDARRQTLQRATEELAAAIRLDQDQLQRDQVERERQAVIAAQVEKDRGHVLVWQRLRGLIGSHDGRKFRRFAQGLSLDVLIVHANRHLARLTDRYRMRRRGGEELELEIEDRYQAGATRPMASLSGGESFLASLALALGLAALAGRNVRIDSLFIDEGFGSLDADTLDTAISALETLRQDAKTVGIVSHVDLLKERITTQILVEKGAAGASHLRFVA